MTESDKGKGKAGRAVVRVAVGDSFQGLGALRAQSDDKSFAGASSIRPKQPKAPAAGPKNTQSHDKPPTPPSKVDRKNK